MGISISWIAIDEKFKDRVLDDLSFVGTKEKGELGISPIVGFNTPTKYFLVAANSVDHKMASQSNLEKISLYSDVIVCRLDEHVMYSSIAFWSHGNNVWSVEHDAQRGILDLKTKGSPPSNFEEILSEMQSNQKNEDLENPEVDFIFEVPLKIAQSIVGFKHDETFSDLLMEKINDLSVKPWWRFW